MRRNSVLLKSDIRDEMARLEKALSEYREAVAGADLCAADPLRRMKLEIPGVRPRVLSDGRLFAVSTETFAEIERFLADLPDELPDSQ